MMPSEETPGLPQTVEELLPVVYSELRRLAAARMAGELPGQTLQPTALVHEALLRLGVDSRWNHEGHFFGAAAEAMRRILIDRAREKAAVRHGGKLERVDYKDGALDLAWETEPDKLLAVNEAIVRLEQVDATAAQLVVLRFFTGLPNSEAAASLGLSETTAKRKWAYARVFLRRELGGPPLDTPD